MADPLFYLPGFSCYSHVKLTTDLLVLAKPNQSNRRSDVIEYYLPRYVSILLLGMCSTTSLPPLVLYIDPTYLAKPLHLHYTHLHVLFPFIEPWPKLPTCVAQCQLLRPIESGSRSSEQIPSGTRIGTGNANTPGKGCFSQKIGRLKENHKSHLTVFF